MSQKVVVAILNILVLLGLPGLVLGQSSRTGRISSGSLPTRPACPDIAAAGDAYTAVNQTPVISFLCDTTFGWLTSDRANPPLPNTVIAFTATPTFPASFGASYSMTLTGNVTSSTISGTPANGNLLSLTLTEDATGGRTFAFPGNFGFTPSFTLNTAANAINELTFKFDGINWHLISNSGSGGGGTPAGVMGNVQLNNVGVFGVGGENGGVFSTTRDTQLKGPNPWFDIRSFGARAVNLGAVPAANCSITSGTTAMTLSAASTFVNGDGIVCREAGPTIAISAPSAPTVTAMNAKSFTGTGVFVANSSGATSYSYCVMAETVGGGFTPCSATTTITNGAATLGATIASISSWTRSNTTITVTTTANHNMAAGTWMHISGGSGVDGWFQTITATPGTTTFTFSNGSDTRNGAATSGGKVGTIVYYVGNHITWPAVTNAWKYVVYDTVRNACVGISLPETTGLSTDPLYDEVDDFGPTVSTCPAQPAWFPTTPPVAAKNEDLVTTIVSGAGTISLVVANAASNTVSGKVAILDNTPNIQAAAATAPPRGVVYIPSITNADFVTNSVMTITHNVAFNQSGILNLGDTVRILGNVKWKGFPDNPVDGGGTFSLGLHPSIQATAASPMIYAGNSVTRFENLTLKGVATNSQVLFLIDRGGLPGNTFKNVGFFTGGSADWNSQHLIIRNNAAGGAFFTFDTLNFVSGPNISDNAWTPLFQNTQGMSPFVFKDIMMSRRGLVTGGPVQGTFNNIYCQGCVTPKINFLNSQVASPIIVNADITNSVEDTTTQPVVSYTSLLQGMIKIFASNTTFAISGPGTMSVKSGAVGGIGQTTANETEIVQGTAIDGTFSTSANNVYPQKVLNAALGIGPTYKAYVGSVAQAAPTCVVSSGGTVAISTRTFNVAPVFSDGGEGASSATSTPCTTTTGNQTITISWVAVPGAVGYDLYQNGFSFQCAAPFINGGNVTSYVWTGAATCNQSLPQAPGSGPQWIGGQGIGTTSLKVVTSLTTAASTAAKITENVASTNGAGAQFLAQVSTLPGSTAVPMNVFNSLTGSQILPAFTITPTWNTSAAPTAFTINPTNTASAAGSLLADFQLGGTSQWNVDKVGNVTQKGSISAGASPASCGAGVTGCVALGEASSTAGAASTDTIRADSTAHKILVNENNVGELALGKAVAGGTAVLGTSAIASGACATAVTVVAAGVVTTDVVSTGFNGDPTAVVGYTPATTGGLFIVPFPTAGNVNFKVCNPTTSSITPGAITLNWIVVRR